MLSSRHMSQFLVRAQGLRLYLEVWEYDGTGRYLSRFLKWLT